MTQTDLCLVEGLFSKAFAGYSRWQPVRVNRHSLQESINI